MNEFHYFNDSRRVPQKPKYAPADVVSIAIAKRLEQSAKNGVSERQLQYGSLKQPTDNQKSNKKQPSNINEEMFYDTKGNVLEIQPYIFKTQHQSSEEESSEEKPKKQKPSAFHAGHLEFEEIGYKPYEHSKPLYTVVHNSEPAKHGCNKRQPQRHRHQVKSCDCYKDLVVNERSNSDQSMSSESDNDQQYNPRFST